jgi:hypothetical protein
MTEYRLHCFAQSGNSYKVALMLESISSTAPTGGQNSGR